MAITVNALLKDPQGNVLANLDGQVYLFAMNGTAKLIGSGKSAADGNISIGCNFTAVAGADYQPRLQLRLKRGTSFVEASENPQSFNGVTCNFGTVTFNPNVVVLYQAIMINPADLTQLQTQVNSLTVSKTTLEQQVTSLTQNKSTLESQVNTLTLNNTSLSQQVSALTTLRATALAEVQARDAMIAQKNIELQNAQQNQQQTQQTMATQLAQQEATVAQLQEQMKAYEQSETPQIGLTQLVQTTADQIKSVQSQLQSNLDGIQLGKVSLQLKVMTGSSASSVGLPRTRDIEKVGANALSQLQFDFHPAPKERAAPAESAPNVLGYTELVARRKLAEHKLTAEVFYQLVLDDEQHGRVLSQTPAAGAALTSGSIIIAIGRKG